MTDTNLNDFILFEDDYLVILNKPTGLLAIEDGYDIINKENLRSLLREKYGAIWTVHRLDKNTSGVIIFTKGEGSHRQLNMDFSGHKIKKNYRGIVNGTPIKPLFEINLPLKINGDRKHRTVFSNRDGKQAKTYIETISTRGNFSYLDIYPQTGITHQIRAHLASIGYPIFGDTLYTRCCKIPGCKDFSINNCGPYFLHAFSINFIHPILQKQLFISAPLPKAFNEMLKALDLSG